MTLAQCGKTARAMTKQRCLDAYAPNSGNASDLTCKRAVKKCQDMGATPDQIKAAAAQDVQNQEDAAAAAAVQSAISPTTSPSAGGGALGVADGAAPAAGGGNTMLYVGIGAGVLVLGLVVFIVMKKPSGSTSSTN